MERMRVTLEGMKRIKKEMAMGTNRHGKQRELFASVSDDGTRWAFEVLREDGWAITRNGVRVAVGTADRASVASGVKTYRALTHSATGAQCDPIVQKHLDRIAVAIQMSSPQAV
jgi:hypothetical protein